MAVTSQSIGTGAGAEVTKMNEPPSEGRNRGVYTKPWVAQRKRLDYPCPAEEDRAREGVASLMEHDWVCQVKKAGGTFPVEEMPAAKRPECTQRVQDLL